MLRDGLSRIKPPMRTPANTISNTAIHAARISSWSMQASVFIRA
jgi:hypothetical protein